MKKIILGLTVVLLFNFSVVGQINVVEVTYPHVGTRCPDFLLQNIRHYPLKKARVRDFAGKWLVLDFWNKYCGACIASFPRISNLQRQFADKVQFMMVGVEDPEKQIELKFEKYRIKEKLIMPCAFDSLLANKWDIYTAPHIVILDNTGIVRGITSHIDSAEIASFLEGGNPELTPTYDPTDTVDHSTPLDLKSPLLLKGNGGNDTDFIFRSILSKWNAKKQKSFAPLTVEETINKNSLLQITGCPLYLLFNYAFFGRAQPGGHQGDSGYGKFYNDPILELKDSSLFKNPWMGNNFYAYSLSIHKAYVSVGEYQAIMQSDLQHYFGFEAAIEKRKCLSWKLVTTEEGKRKLRAKGGTSFVRQTKSGFVARNWAFRSFLSQIYARFQQEVIFDETGLDGNIDIDIKDDVYLSIDDFRSALQYTGLDLVPAQTEMQVLVIKDRNAKSF